MVQKEDPSDPLRASNEVNMTDAKLTQIHLLQRFSKMVQSCKIGPSLCLFKGLGSLDGLDGQPLCHILVHLTLLNRLLSRGYCFSHDLTWPQQQRCLMICANGNPNLLLNQISMAT